MTYTIASTCTGFGGLEMSVALGDGVVWQQGAYALRRLLAAAVTPVGVAT